MKLPFVKKILDTGIQFVILLALLIFQANKQKSKLNIIFYKNH